MTSLISMRNSRISEPETWLRTRAGFANSPVLGGADSTWGFASSAWHPHTRQVFKLCRPRRLLTAQAPTLTGCRCGPAYVYASRRRLKFGANEWLADGRA